MRKRDQRDQFSRKIGWVRFFLRATLLGFALCFLAASFLLEPALANHAVWLALIGLALLIVGGLCTLVAWLIPFRGLQVQSPCPACGHVDTVLRLPFGVRHICGMCGRRWCLWRGRMTARE